MNTDLAALRELVALHAERELCEEEHGSRDTWSTERLRDDAVENFNIAARNAIPALARLLEAQAGVPEGWKLVPIEPTESMLNEGTAADTEQSRMEAKCVWDAMVSAAPNHPPSEGEASPQGESRE